MSTPPAISDVTLHNNAILDLSFLLRLPNSMIPTDPRNNAKLPIRNEE